MAKLLLGTMLLQVDDNLIGLQLKKARSEAGYSQEDVAKLIGVTWEMISRYENGRSSPMRHLHKLAKIYAKPLTFFLENESEYEQFDVKELARELRDQGVTYNAQLKNVVKVVDKLSGEGLEEDIKKSQQFYEVTSGLTENYTNLFAMRYGVGIQVSSELELKPEEYLIFSYQREPEAGDVVLSFDGKTYSLKEYSQKDLSAPLATLVEVHRRYHSLD